MAVGKLYPHGGSMGYPPGKKDSTPPERTAIGGWSAHAVRRNTEFLRSVEDTQLTGQGFTFTLTLRDCPPSHTDFQNLRKRYLYRIKRAGAIRVHWVTEWQARGVPHLHGMAYFPVPDTPVDALNLLEVLRSHWLEVAGPYNPAPRCQHITPIHDVVGWMQYLAKHASRGLSHYQRSPDNIPKAWRGRSGRMWGHWGDWPTREPLRVEVPPQAAHRYRRIIRGWRIANARAEQNPDTRRRRIVSARRMLKCAEKNLSTVRGTSEWLSLDNHVGLMLHLRDQGYDVRFV
jgi:hypothetical protein